ncbi:MAG: hypothetical protein ACOH2V_08910 [Candidatus Saccharimonadaceae bacterium]
MKNKMTGIILMVMGALILGVGFYVYSANKNQDVMVANNNEVGEVDSNEVLTNSKKNNQEQLELLLKKKRHSPKW